MKALSIRQPHAWAIVNGYKTVENRSTNTSHRGAFLIHASKSGTRKEYAEWVKYYAERGVTVPMFGDVDRGGIVGVSYLDHTVLRPVDTCYAHRFIRRWGIEGSFFWMLKFSHTLPFVPCKGQLGFWEVPDYVIARVKL